MPSTHRSCFLPPASCFRWTGLTIALLALRPWIAVEVTPAVYHAWVWLLSGATLWRLAANQQQALVLLQAPLVRLAVAALLWTACSWSWSIDRDASAAALWSAMEGCVVLAAVGLLPVPRREALIVALALSALAVGALGLHQFFVGFEATRRYLAQAHPGYLLSYHVRTMLESKRIIATFFSPDLLAGFLAAMAPLVLAWRVRARRSRCVALLTLAIIIAALVLTRSFGGLVALTLALALGIGLARDRARLPRGWRLAAAGLAALCGVVVASRWPALTDAASAHNPLARRWNYWSFAWTLIQERPWFGHGAGAFAAAYATVEGAARWPTQMAHNALLQWWVELGLVGATLYGALIVVWLQQARRLLRLQHPWTWGVCVGGIALLLHGLVDYDFAVNQVAFLWWIVVGWMVHEPKHDAAA